MHMCKTLVTVGTLVLVGAGCRTTQQVMDDYEANIRAGNYEQASVEVGELATKNDGSRLLWYLLAGGAKHLSSDWAGAIRQFDVAEDIMIENDQRSVFTRGANGAFAMLSNDRALPYDGGGQDRVFTCLYKAVDYAAGGNIDAARTELNRAAQHQENWIVERRKDIDAASERIKKESEAYAKSYKTEATDASSTVKKVFADGGFCDTVSAKCGFDPRRDGRLETLSARDYMNVYVQYVCGVFRWINGDGGREYLRDAAALRPSNPYLASDAKATADDGIPQNTVWVFVEDGLCPKREEWRLDIPMFLLPFVQRYVLYAGMALPYLVPRDAASPGYSVTTADGVFPAVQVEDVDHLVRTEYDVFMRGALAREITRVVAKVGVQVALGVTADNVSDSKTKLALRIARVGAAAWAATTTAADLRSWTALPKSVSVVRLARPADGTITIGSGIDSVQLQLPEGNSMVFARKPAVTAGMSVRSFTVPNR